MDSKMQHLLMNDQKLDMSHSKFLLLSGMNDVIRNEWRSDYDDIHSKTRYIGAPSDIRKFQKGQYNIYRTNVVM